MTTGNVSQLALVSPVIGDADAIVSQLAFIAITTEQAKYAEISQLAFITVSVEYVIPLHFHGWLVRSIQAFPLFIEEQPQ